MQEQATSSRGMLPLTGSYYSSARTEPRKTWVAASGMCACAATLCYLAWDPKGVRQTSFALEASRSIKSSTPAITAILPHHRRSLDLNNQMSRRLPQAARGHEFTNTAFLRSADSSTPWMIVAAGLVLLALPLSVVQYARMHLARKQATLYTMVPFRHFENVPVHGGASIVSLQGRSGCIVDMLINTPNYRVAMVSSSNVQHIRFAVFALFERFTEKGVRVVMLAQEEARRSGHNHVGTEQLLLGIVGEGTGLAARMLKSYGLDLKTARREVSALIGHGEDQVGVEIPFTPRAKKVLDGSQQQARNLGHNYIGTEHLLLALLEEEAGTASKVFENLKIERQKVVQEMLQVISEEAKPAPELELAGARVGPAQQKGEEKQESTLAQFSVNLTEKAAKGLLDPLVGRELELERVIQILGRRTKNNPCLIGEPGVGKTAIAEGLAQLIATGDVPDNLQNKQVTQLDLSLLIAGTKFRGEFEERLKKVLDEVRENNNIILVIDEIHTLVGAGAAEGAIDAANIMKPGLARGEFQLIGATTISEYRKYIEKDAALERRFQPAMVAEPTEDQAIEILRGLKTKYEDHHKLKYADEAIEAAVRLSVQYINDRFLPDKAIDLLDEAGSCRRLAQSRATAASPLHKMQMQLKRLMEEKATDLQNHNFDHAALLRTQIAELEEKIAVEQEVASESQPGGLAADDAGMVTAEHIANIVARWTGIPVEKVSKAEGEALLGLEQKLHEKVVGQDEAVSGIARALRRSRVGMKDPNRPIASLFFLGPTGVGKTQLAKALANLYFGNESAMIRLDMSEFMERHTVSKLIGSPPGYVGFDEGGQLTEQVRKKPYSLLLFDEIEKAHPDVFNMMLQILEDGRLTDSQGRTVSFKNCLVIMTSNVGSQQLLNPGVGRLGFAPVAENQAEQTYQSMKQNVQEAMKMAFKPEFLNRIDEIVVFKQLTRDQVGKVADIMLNDVYGRLAAQGITLSVTQAFKDKLMDHGWNPVYGARPLRRAINTMLEDALSDCVLRGDIESGDSIRVDVDASGKVVVVGKNGVLNVQTAAALVPAGIA